MKQLTGEKEERTTDEQRKQGQMKLDANKTVKKTALSPDETAWDRRPNINDSSFFTLRQPGVVDRILKSTSSHQNGFKKKYPEQKKRR